MSTGKWKKFRKQQPPVSLVCTFCSIRFTKPAYYYKFRIRQNPDVKFFCTKKCHTDSMKKDPKKKTRSRSSKLRSVQNIVNLYCRLRDCNGETGTACISCGKWTEFEKGDGGHFIPQGSSNALRFDERNINFQCHSCNRFKHGNLHNYYEGMIRKYGKSVVDELMETQYETKKWTDEDIKDLKEEFRKKIADIRAGRTKPDSSPLLSEVFADRREE